MASLSPVLIADGLSDTLTGPAYILNHTTTIPTFNLLATDGILTPNHTTKSSKATQEYLELVRDIQFYLLGIIIPVGIATNLLSIFVFTRSFMRHSTTGHYLISLAFADITLLVGEFLKWINGSSILNLRFMDTINLWCKVVHYIRYAGRIWSSWLTVIITVERFVTIAFPLRVARISTPTKAKLVIIVELLLSFAITSFPFFTVEVLPHKDTGQPRCQMTKPAIHYTTCLLIVMGGGELVIPSFIVCIFTALILLKLAEATRERRRQLEGQAHKNKSRGSSHERQLTLILVAVAITFVVVRLPYTISFYINEYKEELWEKDAWLFFIIYAINAAAGVLAVVNYAINFFLYCMCGSTFRRELRKAFGCWNKNAPQRNHTTITTSAASPSPMRRAETRL